MLIYHLSFNPFTGCMIENWNLLITLSQKTCGTIQRGTNDTSSSTTITGGQTSMFKEKFATLWKRSNLLRTMKVPGIT